MKTMRKLFTVLLAMVMTLALAVPAFAADTGSITITNPQGDHTYTAYKIFDVSYDADGHYAYTISKDSAAYDVVKDYTNGLTLADIANTNKCSVSIDAAAFSAASFAQYLNTKVASLGVGTDFTKVDNTMKVKASSLDLGYYFVSGTSGAVCELTTAKNIEIHDKNEVPEIKKDVNDEDRTVEVGQKLTYTITGKVPSTTGYTEYTYEVTDTMSEGLTFNKDVKVTIGGTDVTAAATITNKANGFVASVNMKDYQEQIDAPVLITYTATVNENAIQRDKETNTAKLKYSNDPADNTSSKETPGVEVDVFSFNIVINKYASGNETTKLADAKFVLKNNAGKYYKYDTATKAVTWVDVKSAATVVTTDANGAARFNGLQTGTYKLEETAAPTGYNQLTKDIAIELKKDGSTIGGVSSNLGTDLSLTTNVANSTGTMLPETGGTGTVIFVALGALAVICAGVFLVTNKRMSKESF